MLTALPVVAQQPAHEHIVDVSGPVEGAIEAQVKTFKEGGRPEVLRMSDVLMYPYGVYQPVLTCTILRACIIELQSGETIISLVAGDDLRWLIDHTATGPGGITPLVTVKPTDHNVTTNLVISTNRRVYHITLDSPPGKADQSRYNPLDPYTRHITFYYPADGVRRLTAMEELAVARKENIVTAVGHDPSLSELNYHYGWRTKRGFPWEPIVVFDDAQRVYIKLPKKAFALDQPLLSIDYGGQEQVVHYAVRDGFYVVDHLFTQARLILHTTRPVGLLRKKRQVQQELQIFPRPN